MKPKLSSDANEEFAHFFLALGYKVYVDGKRSAGERWYEFYDEHGLAFQISMPPPPIAELIADLPHFADDRAGVGPADYWCACDNNNKLHELLSRVQKMEIA
jgi:hypothetical protein